MNISLQIVNCEQVMQVLKKLNQVMTGHEQLMNKSLRSHEQIMNKSRTSHEKVMNESLTTHNNNIFPTH